MNYHIIVSKKINVALLQEEVARKQRPRYIFLELSRRLNALFHSPLEEEDILSVDKVFSKFIGGSPEVWAMARRLSHQISNMDRVFCSGEDIGIPLCLYLGWEKKYPKIAMFAHNLHSPRKRFALKYLRTAKQITRWITNEPIHQEFLKNYLGIQSGFSMIIDQTDTNFFEPASTKTCKKRPMIASVGLEKRDYQTLACATKELDVDVKITSFSRDAKLNKLYFPQNLPENMTQQYYSWLELVQLYQDADLVVISLTQASFTAGITSIVEALACECPVIVTETTGLSYFLSKVPVVAKFQPGNSLALKQAIIEALNNRKNTKRLAKEGHRLVKYFYHCDAWLNSMEEIIRSL